MPATRPTPPRPVVLCVLDGWGDAPPSERNAIALARTPNWDEFRATGPHALVDASEHFVGLPDGQMGNSEVGHMNLGAGRVVMQDLPRIDAAVEDGWVSFDIPEYTGEITGLGTIRLLEAIRESGLKPKFYQASSSEMFGKVLEVPQKETTPFYPRSPYGAAKVYSYWITVNYREAYNLFACNGILFNHESPRRGETFVTRKITKAAARIKLGIQQDVFLGNLDAKRDWGYAGDYVEAMWMMLQAPTPEDYVIATGETHTVKEMLELAFDRLQLDWKKHVKIDAKYYRPTEVDLLIGDASKAKKQLGWQPKVRFEELVAMMVDADLALERERLDGTRKRG